MPKITKSYWFCVQCRPMWSQSTNVTNGNGQTTHYSNTTYTGESSASGVLRLAY